MRALRDSLIAKGATLRFGEDGLREAGDDLVFDCRGYGARADFPNCAACAARC